MNLKTSLKIAVLLIAAAVCGQAQATYTTGTPHRYYVGVLSTSMSPLVGGTVYIRSVTLINDSISSVTISVKDGGTACSSGPCLLTPTGLSLAAGQMYVIDFPGEIAPGGVQASASSNSAVTIRLHYLTSPPTP